MTAANTLLDRVLSSIRAGTADERVGVGVITASARVFGARPVQEDVTIPTGFDAQAVALFEAIVEASFLIATADGEFDEAERDAFEAVITAAASGAVAGADIHALVSDFADQLAEDGLDVRMRRVGELVRREEARREVLRVAALLAHVSGGVSDVERGALAKLAAALGQPGDAADRAIADVVAALG